MRNDVAGEGLPGGFDPIVFLYASPPGSVTKIKPPIPKGDGNTSDSNSHDNGDSALDIGDVFGQVDTRIDNADLGDPHTTNFYAKGVVSCNNYAGLEPPGSPNQGLQVHAERGRHRAHRSLDQGLGVSRSRDLRR